MKPLRASWVACPRTWIVGLAALLVGAAGVPANVTPPTMLLIHVQPFDPSYCDLPGIEGCEDLAQTTSESGWLLAVVYLVCGYSLPGSPVSLDFTLQWSPGWGFGGVANCTDAEFSYDYDYGNRATLHFDWPEHAYVEPFMPLCAFELDVAVHDCVEVLGDATIQWTDGHGWWWYEAPVPGRAEAGVECEYACLVSCHDWGYVCAIHLAPEELSFELPQGAVGQGLLQSVVTGCTAGPSGFDATEPWVTLEVTQTSGTTHDVGVTVNTAGLAVGEYEARVRATYDTRDCSRIHLTVTEPDPQTIPADETPPAEDAQPRSWGGVKDLYR